MDFGERKERHAYEMKERMTGERTERKCARLEIRAGTALHHGRRP